MENHNHPVTQFISVLFTSALFQHAYFSSTRQNIFFTQVCAHIQLFIAHGGLNLEETNKKK